MVWKRGLIPGGDQQKVFGSATVLITEPNGYQARMRMFVHEPRQVDLNYARQAGSGCGSGAVVPSELRGDNAIAWAVRVEGHVEDTRRRGFSWDPNTAVLILDPYQVGNLPADIEGHGQLFPAGCDRPRGDDPLAKIWWDPFINKGEVQVGQFAWDVVVWTVRTPDRPTVDAKMMRASALAMAGLQSPGGNNCVIAKISSTMREHFPGCTYGPKLPGDR